MPTGICVWKAASIVWCENPRLILIIVVILLLPVYLFFPVVDETIAVEINLAELRIDTYRASGAGGQHVNTTDSAVRITHEPTGIVVQCQNDRSQHKNRAEAMSMLRARLYKHELELHNSEKNKIEQSKDEITWGRQIRSYVLDQSRIKDLRSGYESGNPRAILDVRFGRIYPR